MLYTNVDVADLIQRHERRWKAHADRARAEGDTRLECEYIRAELALQDVRAEVLGVQLSAAGEEGA